MKVCMASAANAFDLRHLRTLNVIDGVTFTSVVDGVSDDIECFAKARDIIYWAKDSDNSRVRDDLKTGVFTMAFRIRSLKSCAQQSHHAVI